MAETVLRVEHVGTVSYTHLDVYKRQQFLFMNLDYARTERVQFEDDDYYYYVKAVPKKTVAVRAVSYTHLDVYKRQILTWFKEVLIWCTICQVLICCFLKIWNFCWND